MIHADTLAYNKAREQSDREICDLLANEIAKALPYAENKVWHGHPVWFLDGNPVVGYGKLKDCVRILFWSGQSFPTAGLAPEGKFKAAEARYEATADVKKTVLRKWLADAREIQWDYKNIVKRKGKLERLPAPLTVAKPGKKAASTSTTAIDVYIANAPAEIQPLLEQVRKAIKSAAPAAEETLKYQIPTFVLGENLVHFAAFKQHIGFYPTPAGIEAFKKELSRYKGAKGSVQFPLDEPLPLKLITTITKFRVKQAQQRTKAR